MLTKYPCFLHEMYHEVTAEVDDGVWREHNTSTVVPSAHVRVCTIFPTVLSVSMHPEMNGLLT